VNRRRWLSPLPPLASLAPLAALLVAGAPLAAPPAATAGPASQTAAGRVAPPADTGLTGILSEEDFKALHELTRAKAPPARGGVVEIAGTKAYLSLPERPGPVPGVVVIHEWWGLNDHVRHWTDRLAARGWAALAVDLYGGAVAADPDAAMAAMKAVDEAAALATLRAAHRFLQEDPRVRAPRTASVGWCFGGGWSLQLALAEPELDAAVIYYGRLVTEPERLQAIRADVLGVFGTQDQGIPPDVVDAFDTALDRAVVPHAILRYDAQHAFANPSSARYDQASAADAWERVQAFLERSLSAP